jgi:hypothetical protein
MSTKSSLLSSLTAVGLIASVSAPAYATLQIAVESKWCHGLLRRQLEL